MTVDDFAVQMYPSRGSLHISPLAGNPNLDSAAELPGIACSKSSKYCGLSASAEE